MANVNGKNSAGQPFQRRRLLAILGLMVGVLLVVSACGGGTDFETVTLTVDLQPDPATLVLDDTNGDGRPSPREAFSVLAGLYEPGTAQKTGDFICWGIFLADVTIVGLDQPPSVVGGVAGQFSAVDQVYTIGGRGQLHVSGTEPGADGTGNLDRIVTGGTGEFQGAVGTVRFQPALGATLSPAFQAPAVAGTPVTFLSGRLTFTLQVPEG